MSEENKEVQPQEKPSGWAMPEYMRTYLFMQGHKEVFDWPENLINSAYAMAPDPIEVGFKDYLGWLESLGQDDPKFREELKLAEEERLLKQNERSLHLAKLQDKSTGGGALKTED